MLVELRQLLPRARVEAGAPLVVARGVGPERVRLVPRAPPLLPGREAQPHAVRGVAREPRGERPPIAAEAPREVHRLPEPAEPGQLRGAELLVMLERAPEPAEQRDQREHVLAVVLEDARERRGAARAEEVEVERRDQGAGHVVVAREAEHLALERPEPAVGEARREDPARGPEQVEVGQEPRPAAPREDEARLEQRQVEARAVERDETARPLEHGRQRREQRRLLVEVAQEVLRDDEAVGLAPARAHEERVRARAAGEAGRLGVEEEETAPVRRGGLRPGERGEQRKRRRERGRERRAAVGVRERVLAADDEERAGAGVLDLAAEDRLDGPGGRARRPPRLDATDHAAQVVERLHGPLRP